jgi:hypothetical protein
MEEDPESSQGREEDPGEFQGRGEEKDHPEN